MTKNIALSLLLLVSTLFAPLTTFAKEDAKKCSQTGITFVNSGVRATPSVLSDTETYSYTASSQNSEGMVLNVFTNFAAPTAVSYAGKNAVLVATKDDSVGNFLSTWRLENPSFGLHDIVITGLTITSYLEVNVIEYSGVNQTNMDGGHNVAITTDGGSLVLSQTPSTNNSWIMSFVRNQNQPAMTPVTGINSLRLTGSQSAIGDTGGAVSAVSYEMSWTSPEVGVANFGIIMAISPANASKGKKNDDKHECGSSGVAFVNSASMANPIISSSTESFMYSAGTQKNEGMIINVFTNFSAPSSVSYSGKNAKLVAVKDDSVGNFLSTWRIEAATPGANSIVVSGLTPGWYLEVSVAEYAGVDQNNMDGGHSVGLTPDGGALTLSQSVAINNAWVVSFVRNQNQPTMTPSTGVVAQRTTGAQSAFGDTNGPVPKGAYSMSWTSPEVGVANFGIIMAIKPAK